MTFPTGRAVNHATGLSRFRNCENVISITAVEEITYRQSRLCRLLGQPVIFAMVGLLTGGKET
jgi:hypothetical protein